MKWNVYAISYHLQDVVGRDDDDQAVWGPARGAATQNVAAESYDAAFKGLVEELDGGDKTAVIVDHVANGPQDVLVVPPDSIPEAMETLLSKLSVAKADLQAANERIAQLEGFLNQKPAEQPAQPEEAQNQAAAIPDPEKPTIN